MASSEDQWQPDCNIVITSETISPPSSQAIKPPVIKTVLQLTRRLGHLCFPETLATAYGVMNTNTGFLGMTYKWQYFDDLT